MGWMAEQMYEKELELEDELLELRLTREKQWESGVHYDKYGDVHCLSNMETSHIKNTISYFDKLDYDIKPLQKELEKRLLTKQ